MSYDLYVLPAQYCTDRESAAHHVNTQVDLPAHPTARAVAERISARDPDSEEDGFLSAQVGAEGDCVPVPSPFSKIQAARDVVLDEAFRAGMGVYDPQNGLVLDPREAVPGIMTSSSEGDYATVTPGAIDHLTSALGIDDYLIVETGSDVYTQTMRLDDNRFTVEVRDGSSDRHFATEVSDPIAVARLMRAWLAGDQVVDRSWQKLDL